MVQTGAGSAPRRARKQLIFGRQGGRLLLALAVPIGSLPSSNSCRARSTRSREVIRWRRGLPLNATFSAVPLETKDTTRAKPSLRRSRRRLADCRLQAKPVPVWIQPPTLIRLTFKPVSLAIVSPIQGVLYGLLGDTEIFPHRRSHQ